MSSPKPAPHRDETDASLRAERAKTDTELARNRAEADQQADDALAAAHRSADQSRMAARASADANRRAGPRERMALEDERASEDYSLAVERHNQREMLVNDRATSADHLAMLLHLEREQTDRDLLLERHRSDALVESRDDFLAIVSHDLRVLLGGIALSAFTTLNRAGDAPELQPFRDEAQRTQRYVARMNRIVGDLLDVVSLDAGTLAVQPANHDAAEIVRELAELFTPLAAAAGVTLRCSVSDDSILGRFDHARVVQVLANLINNALKFTGAGGSIDVEVRAEGAFVAFSVRDTGPGIAAERLPTIFDRFARGERGPVGLGLGLYISRCIVEQHGGTLRVASEPGVGSTFTFTLPA